MKISNTDKCLVEYKSERLICTPYYLFSAYSNYIVLLCGLTLISISIVKPLSDRFENDSYLFHMK